MCASWSALAVEPSPQARYSHAEAIMARLSQEGMLRPRLNHQPSPVRRLCADRLREADADGALGAALYAYCQRPQVAERSRLTALARVAG
jgi:hypothetical protein